MLAVITDDFTGAAEIGGLALAKGFSATIETRAVHPTSSDVLVLATNMRSMPAEVAREVSARLTTELMALRPTLIFKKVDSVLRGHIGPELAAMMEAEGKRRALLVPANPSLGRLIEGGIYSVGGVPIAETGFATDGVGATHSSNVADILRGRGCPDLTSLPAWAYSPSIDGIVVGDARSMSDLTAWAGKVDGNFVPAGGADFFSALLDCSTPERAVPPAASPSVWGSKSLYVCGSRFPASSLAVQAAAANGYCVVRFPDAVYFNREHDPALIRTWAAEVVDAFGAHDAVILAAPQSATSASLNGSELTRLFARCATLVFQHVPVEELLIEGGATAQAVMDGLGIEALYPVQSLSPGVTRMRAGKQGTLHVTMKPGSYSWPGTAWTFDKKRVA